MIVSKYIIIKGKSYVEASDYDELIYKLKNSNDKIAELESELEVKDNLLKIKNGLNESSNFETDRLVKLPFDPLETANMLINATYERETNAMERAFYKCGDTETVQRYSINDLEQIAEHLLVYCKHNKESEE